ncbi:uncharacterized protein AB675_6954 [Cyphellophora attinorum]|uniref:Uncharacterized protein n=1 Tax=Cyphellophora attinorum TaxID=1664694 RepID=A0A0N1P0D1_9EURO|nr:uncharacterized protein AB675_6954 [Phialophora attinorum]KPI43380.1 hypothetical protein AB675_6954 [Phialophora attinorum]
MAPELSRQAPGIARRWPVGVVQPALPQSLPGLKNKYKTQATRQPASSTPAQNSVSELPALSRPLPPTQSDPDNIEATRSQNAPEFLNEAPAEASAKAADVGPNAADDPQTTERSTQDSTEESEAPHELGGRAGDQSEHELVGDNPVTHTSHPEAVSDDVSGDVSNTISRASPRASVSEQGSRAVSAADTSDHATLPTEIDGRATFPDELTQPSRTVQNGYTVGSDEGYASHEHTGPASATSPQSAQPNGVSASLSFAQNEPAPFISLADHLLQLSYTKAWADYSIFLNPRHSQPPIVAQTHHSSARADVFDAHLHYARRFRAALRFLYSDAILTAEALVQPRVSSGSQVDRSAMLLYILSYWVSGLLLGIEHVTNRAAKLLSEVMDWDVVEGLLKQTEFLTSGSDPEFLDADIDWAGLARQWKSLALAFIATSIDPSKTNLDTASVSSLASRFGSLDETRTKHNPKLRSMVFGSMPATADISPSTTEPALLQTTSFHAPGTAISRILLNVDYGDLAQWHEQSKAAYGEAGSTLLANVVAEREVRRVKLLNNHPLSSKHRSANSDIWEVVGWKEAVINGRLTRDFVGFFAPQR